MNKYIKKYRGYCLWLIDSNLEGNRVDIGNMGNDILKSVMDNHSMAKDLFYEDLPPYESMVIHSRNVAREIIEHYKKEL